MDSMKPTSYGCLDSMRDVRTNESLSRNGRVSSAVSGKPKMTEKNQLIFESAVAHSSGVLVGGKRVHDRCLSLTGEPAGKKICNQNDEFETLFYETPDQASSVDRDLDTSDKIDSHPLDILQLSRLSKACEDRALINQPYDDFGLPPLHAAIKYRRPDLVFAAIENGAKIHCQCSNGLFPLHYLSLTADREILDFLKKKFPDLDMNVKCPDGDTALIKSITEGYDDFATSMIEYGADINQLDADGNNLLIYALLYREQVGMSGEELSELIILLVQNMTMNSLTAESTTDGRSLMLIASERNEFELMEMLINRGVDINGRSEDNTSPVQEAMNADSWEVASLLIDLGAEDINVLLKNGSLPLQAAVKYGAWDAAEGLIKRHADGINELLGEINERLDDERTVFMMAILIYKSGFADKIVKSGEVDLDKVFEDGKTHRELVWNGFKELRGALREETFTVADVYKLLMNNDELVCRLKGDMTPLEG